MSVAQGEQQLASLMLSPMVRKFSISVTVANGFLRASGGFECQGGVDWGVWGDGARRCDACSMGATAPPIDAPKFH
jgi:hypothetical protein